jgi:hypothetical protein
MANDLVISANRAPVLSRHLAKLIGVRDRENLKDAPLVPRDDMPALMAELKRCMTSCADSDASKLSELLFGSYPNHKVADPDAYSRGVVSILAEYPLTVAARAVDLVSRKCKFLPTRAELFDELERLMGQLRWALFVAEQTDAERKRRRDEWEDRIAAERSRQAFLERHNGKSPLDVLREKGLYSNEGNENVETEISGSRHAQGSNAGGSDEPRKPRRGRKSRDRAAAGG